MSDTDSFIEEVTEEVQRDRLFKTMRKYGWIAGLVIVLIVGGTAFNEYRSAQTEAAAKARGDAILLAMETQDPEDREAALSELAEMDGATVVEVMLSATSPTETNLQALRDIASDAEQPQRFQQLAKLKLAVLSTDLPATERADMLRPLAAAGGLYRSVASEYLMATLLEAGDKEAAIAMIQQQLAEAGTSQAQIQRLREYLTALGVEPELATASQSDN